MILSLKKRIRDGGGGVIGKLSEGAVFLLFLPHPPDRSPVCCSHPTPEPRGMFTALEDTRGGGSPRWPRPVQGAALGYRRKVECGTSNRQGRCCPSNSVGSGRAIQAGRGGVEPGMYHVTRGKAAAEDLSGGQAEYKFGAPFYLMCTCVLSCVSRV